MLGFYGQTQPLAVSVFLRFVFNTCTWRIIYYFCHTAAVTVAVAVPTLRIRNVAHTRQPRCGPWVHVTHTLVGKHTPRPATRCINIWTSSRIPVEGGWAWGVALVMRVRLGLGTKLNFYINICASLEVRALPVSPQTWPSVASLSLLRGHSSGCLWDTHTRRHADRLA